MKNQAFTLVELIVVVTILAILATIGFVSYSRYLTGVRDTNRIASLTSISDGLELYRTRNDLPDPDDAIDIQIESKTIASQGYVGSNVLQTIEYSKAGKDPKDDSYYSYYLTDNKKHYQLMAFLEESDNLETALTPPLSFKRRGGNFIYSPLLEGVGAVEYKNRHPKVYGKKLGILTNSDNTPVQEIITGILNFTGGTNTIYKARFTDTEIIEGSGSILKTIAGNASCKRMKELKGGSQSGIYNVNPTGTGEFEVYCNMTLQGGGWTLVLKADGNNQTFTHASPLWRNTLTLNPSDLSENKTEFKSELFVTQSLNEVLLVLETGSEQNSLVIPKRAPSLHNIFNGSFSASNIGKQKWLGSVPGGSLQPNCDQEGFNAYRVRIGISSNNESSCGSNDSYLGIGLQPRTGASPGAPFTSSVGNNCGSSNCSEGNKQINSFGYVYIR